MFSLLMAIILLASAQPAPVAPVIDMEPAVSADGSLAFASNRSGGFDIFTVDAEGGGIRQITEGGGKDTPAWSPDGALLAFSWDRNGDADLFVVPREGGAPVQITGG
ncbi:MAG: PD40 domain-containing protein, partial [Hyphomonadaceae bacterium]|nr:PD40 domain-containing protein [Hyphomonadaceae bacterium]